MKYILTCAHRWPSLQYPSCPSPSRDGVQQRPNPSTSCLECLLHIPYNVHGDWWLPLLYTVRTGVMLKVSLALKVGDWDWWCLCINRYAHREDAPRKFIKENFFKKGKNHSELINGDIFFLLERNSSLTLAVELLSPCKSLFWSLLGELIPDPLLPRQARLVLAANARLWWNRLPKYVPDFIKTYMSHPCRSRGEWRIRGSENW